MSKASRGNACVATRLTRATLPNTPIQLAKQSEKPICFANAGGCDFAMIPDFTAMDEPVFWAPEVDTGLVLVGTAPEELRSGTEPRVPHEPTLAQSQTDGGYMVHGEGASAVHSVLLDGAAPHDQLAIIIPLDAAMPDRLAAAERFWRILRGVPAPNTRLSPQRRRRVRQMLRSVDGRRCDASYREIADTLFGHRRVQADLWHESSLRYATMRLVRDGMAMIDGGYRDLLRHRRRN